MVEGTENERVHWLYRCYNERNVLLYIGATRDINERAREHRCRTPWWPEVAVITQQIYPSLQAARVAESKKIALEQPLYNIAGLPRTDQPRVGKPQDICGQRVATWRWQRAESGWQKEGRYKRSYTLYRAFAEDGSLLYIGTTTNFTSRMAAHRRSSPWWPEVHHVTTEQAPHPNRSRAILAEEHAIRTEAPKYNRLHRGSVRSQQSLKFLRIKPGNWGKIRTMQRGDRWIAMCTFRDSRGVLSQRAKSGPSAAAAIRALETSLSERRSQ
jgi:predicted GIY-YIG superfamily endonuclease